MHLPLRGLLVGARLVNQLVAAKVERLHQHYTEARWNSALTSISNREARIARRFNKKRMSTATLESKVKQLARRQLIVDDSLRPRHVDKSVGITTERLQNAVHLKLLSIRCQMPWQPDDKPRREIDRLIQNSKPDDRPIPRTMPSKIAESISPGVHQYRDLPKATSRSMVRQANTDRFNLSDWHEISKTFWTMDSILGYESFNGIVSAGVDKILSRAPLKCSTVAEQRCRLTFEVLEFIHRQEPENPLDEWSPQKFLFDTYRSIVEGEVVEHLLAERTQARTDSPTWNDSAVGSAGSSSVYSGMRSSSMTGIDYDDDSDNWSDGEGDFNQHLHFPAASSTPGTGRYP